MVSIPEGEPLNPEPTTPDPKALAPSVDATTTTAEPTATDTSVLQEFKPEPSHLPLSAADPVTFEPDQEQTINSDTLHALVEQLRPPASPATSLEQIVIIRTVDATEGAAPPQ